MTAFNLKAAGKPGYLPCAPLRVVFIAVACIASIFPSAAYSTVTYDGSTGVNAQVFTAQCGGCHFSGAAVPNWMNYATADANIVNIRNRIDRASSDPLVMPPGAQMSSTLRNLVAAWDAANEPQHAAPQVATTNNGTVNKYSATLNGTIRENGINTSARFRYWRNVLSEPLSCPSNTTNSGCTSSATTISGTGGNDVAVAYSRTASGLACGTLYRYRAISVSNGTYGQQSASGTDTFTTDACPAFISSAVTTATEDVLYQYDANANQSVTYSLTVFPAGMTINSLTGLIQWTPPNGVTSANVTVRITDGTTPTTQSYVINVTPVNDLPVISNVNAINTYVEGAGGEVIDSTITVSDIDSTNCNGAEIDITTGHQSSEDVLEYSGGLTSLWDDVNGTLTLSDISTCANYANQLELVTYRNTSQNPNTSNRTIAFRVSDADTLPTVWGNTDTTTMQVSAVNTPATLSGVNETNNYTEPNNPGVIIDSAISITDPDNTNCNQATIDISIGHQPGEDVLEYTGSVTGVTNGGFAAGTGTLTLNSSTTCANLATALQNVRYRNTSLNPNTATRTIVFQARDSGNVLSTTDSTTVTVTAVNTAPTISGVNESNVYSEGALSGVIIDSAISVTDPDSANCNQATIDLSTNYQSTEDVLEYTGSVTGVTDGGFVVGTGTLTLNSTTTCANLATALQNVRYRNTSLSPNTSIRTVDFQVRDASNALSSIASTTVTTSAVSTPPTISGINETNTYVEPNNPGVIIDSAITITDPDTANCNRATIDISTGHQSGEDLLEYTGSVTGVTDGGFVAGTGTLTLNSTTTCANLATALQSVRYRNSSLNPNTANRTIDFQVRDSSNTLSSVQSTTVSITAVNTAPTLSGVSETNTYVEPNNPGVVIDSVISVTDPDSPNCNRATIDISTNHQSGEDLLEYTGSVTGVTDGGFVAGTGTLTLNSTTTCANLATALQSVRYRNTSENPNTATRTIDFQVRDSASLDSNVDSTTVAITAVNTAPTLSAVDNPAVYIEDANPGVIIDNSITLVDPDSPNCNQATVDISTNHQAAEDLLEYTGSVTGVTDGGFVAGTGTLTLNSTTTCANLVTALQNVRYRNTSNNPNTSNRTVVFQVRDSGNVLSNTDSTTVSVTPQNDTPTPADDAYSVVVNVTDLQLNVLVNDTDPDTDSLVISAVGTPSAGGSVVIGSPCAANTLCYTAPNNYAGIETIVYTVRDPSLATNTATVTISPNDGDSDGVADFQDNCPSDANAGQQNNDGDSQGDVCDPDDDNDGMPDTWEVANSFNPLDAADAAQDADGDGVSNLQEYIDGTNPRLDDVGPRINGVSDKTVNATGYYTHVDLGTISAVDGGDGPLVVTIQSVTGSTSQADVNRNRFLAGRTTIRYQAQDASLNSVTVDQVIDVRPMATFAADVTVTEGNVASFDVTLSGNAPQYPVNIDYALSGTADAADHDLAAGTLTINSGTTFTFNVNIASDALLEPDETLIVTLSNPSNATLGTKTTQTVTIAAGNVAPSVVLAVGQGGNSGPLLTQGGGNATVTATVSDPNTGDTFTYDWSSVDNLLAPIGGTGTPSSTTFQFDPSVMAVGIYTLNLTVSDSAMPSASAVASVVLSVQAAAPTLGGGDSDGDGTDDTTEGYQDSDIDGIPDYLDAYDQNGIRYLIANQTGALSTTKYIETEAAYSVRQGVVARYAAASGLLVNETHVMSYNSSMGGSNAMGDDSYTNIGGLFDFEIHGVTPGASATVVLPLSSAILAGAEYRKFSMVSGWSRFVEDAHNQIASARSVEGLCPGPNSSAYNAGLNVFDDCVRLTLQDGGPNDVDRAANGVIRDPGGVAVEDVIPESGFTPAPDDGSSGGGGLWHPLVSLLLALLCSVLVRRRYSYR